LLLTWSHVDVSFAVANMIGEAAGDGGASRSKASELAN